MRYQMVDRVTEFVADSHVTAVKNVTRESDVMEHHFHGFPLWPGCMTLESMAQAGGYLVIRSEVVVRGRWTLAALASVSRATFKRPVFPGDQLRIEAALGEVTPNSAEITAVASVEGEVVAKAKFILVHRVLDPETNAEAIAYLTKLFDSFERKGGLLA